MPLIILFFHSVFPAQIVIVVAFRCGIPSTLCGEGALLGAGGFLSKDKQSGARGFLYLHGQFLHFCQSTTSKYIKLLFIKKQTVNLIFTQRACLISLGSPFYLLCPLCLPYWPRTSSL
ncbi:hypothetical protein FGO68_gene16437 [Halteria grandinella]|uniref:Secreted protein n=1 Tax=Halteria grandinella TaxID=5974 RepID=A0A8J8NYQ7_HALGN|nr:hypothetical protein FGO68_gene16437 [Halteria grandinella]